MSPIDTLDHPASTLTDRPDHPQPIPPRVPRPGGDERPWSTRARTVVAALAALAVLGLIGTVAGFTTRGTDGEPASELAAIEQQLEEVRTERDAAIGDVDLLAGRISILQGRVGALEAERDQLADELAGADTDAAELEGRIAELDAIVIGVRAELDAATAARDGALAAVATLETELASARQQAAQAIADKNALAARFPLAVDPSIDVADVVGSYRVAWQEQFCSGLPTCGSVPEVTTANLRATREGYLRIELGNVVTTNLSRVTGGLHAVAGSTTALPACAGAARPATVTVTMYPDTWTVARSGAVEVTTWGGAVTVQAPAAGSCPAALTFSGITLTPTT